MKTPQRIDLIQSKLQLIRELTENRPCLGDGRIILHDDEGAPQLTIYGLDKRSEEIAEIGATLGVEGWMKAPVDSGFSWVKEVGGVRVVLYGVEKRLSADLPQPVAPRAFGFNA